MKVEFLTDLDLRVLPRRRWLLLLPFEMLVTHDDGKQELFVVPAGRITDLSTVPRIPMFFMLLGGRGRKGGAAHDEAYEQQRDRKWADDLFLAVLKAEEPGWAGKLMYAGVRLGGWTRYLKERATWPQEPSP